MYKGDLRCLGIDLLKSVLRDFPLIPSRAVLAEDLDEVFDRIEALGIESAYELRRVLKDSGAQIPLGVDDDYIKILLREINSYEVKPVPLAKLGLLTEGEIDSLSARGIRRSNQLFDLLSDEQEGGAGVEGLGLSVSRTRELFSLINLMRINGIGPLFSRMLFESGIESPGDFLELTVEEILKRWNDYRERMGLRESLGESDILWCKKYCTLLEAIS